MWPTKAKQNSLFRAPKIVGRLRGGGAGGRNNYQGLHAMESNAKYLMSVFLICKPGFSEIGKLLQRKPDDNVIAQNHRLT